MKGFRKLFTFDEWVKVSLQFHSLIDCGER